MPFNLMKQYPDLLEIMQLSENDRTKSLKRIFDRDIADNDHFIFRRKQIRPIKIDGEIDMERLFDHLTTEEIDFKDEFGKEIKKRVFERDRSERLHWVKFHVDENHTANVRVFSVEERNQKLRRNVIKTYIHNIDQKYVIIFELQRSGTDYYLLSAYYLNRKYGEKMIDKKYKKRLSNVA